VMPKIGEALESGPVTRRVRDGCGEFNKGCAGRHPWRTGRTDSPTGRWWLQPFIIVFILTIFIVYSTWAAFQNRYYFVGASMGRDLISPFYSPCIGGLCVPGAKAGFTLNWFRLSPALLILIFPLGFRFTCYYYRRSYYRAFWWSPPACAVSDAHGKYSGETRFPLVMQNLHRYFFYAGLVFNVLLTIDAVEASANRESGGASASARSCCA